MSKLTAFALADLSKRFAAAFDINQVAEGVGAAEKPARKTAQAVSLSFASPAI
jgi:hypothetical protein